MSPETTNAAAATGRDQIEEIRAAGQDCLGGQAGAARDDARQVDLPQAAPVTTTRKPDRLNERPTVDHRCGGQRLAGPAAPDAGSRPRVLPAGSRPVGAAEVRRIGRDAGLREQPAPALDLVLVVPPPGSRRRGRRRPAARGTWRPGAAVLSGPCPWRLTATSAPRASVEAPPAAECRPPRDGPGVPASGPRPGRGGQDVAMARKRAGQRRAAPGRR